MAWTVGSLPELQTLDPKERRALLRRLGVWRVYGGLLMQSACLGLITAGMLFEVLRQFIAVPGGRWPAVVVAIVAAAAWYRFALLRVRAALRLELMRQSADEPLPVCLQCGYDLAMVNVEHCPECGAPTRAVTRAAATRSESRA